MTGGETMDHIVEEGIERYISHIRQMATFTDDQLRTILKKAAIENPEMFETFREAAKKKMFVDIKKMAKDIKSDARSFARKADEF